MGGLLGLGLGLLVLGFVVFANVVTFRNERALDRADGIVVLTGEASRIAEGVRLLQEGRGQRLLISGVNRRIGRDDLRRLTQLRSSVFDCCVDIGYDALDTTGNAGEARAWTLDHHYSSLIVVTASYHMPRSLTEMARLLPETRLIPHSVVPKRLKVAHWWLHLGSTRLLAEEYLKLLPSAFRLATAKLLRPPEVGIRSTAAALSRI